MASVGHVIIGLAAGRWLSNREPGVRALPAMIAFSVLAMAPDADVVAFKLGIPYEAPFGHRGASHALVTAGVLALAFALAMKQHAWAFRRTFLVALVVAASHGLLDAMTTGGLGPALLWPFSEERIFLPVRPIPVAPIGAGMASGRGAFVVLWELVLFLPWLAYAVGGGRKQVRPEASEAPGREPAE